MRRWIVAAALALTPGAAWAQEIIDIPESVPTELPDVDPLDKASCEIRDGWLTVYKAYVLAWNDAKDDGRVGPELHEELVQKLIDQDSFYAETGDAITLCRQMIDTRKTYRF